MQLPLDGTADRDAENFSERCGYIGCDLSHYPHNFLHMHGHGSCMNMTWEMLTSKAYTLGDVVCCKALGVNRSSSQSSNKAHPWCMYTRVSIDRGG
jgi:hypothetical protein